MRSSPWRHPRQHVHSTDSVSPAARAAGERWFGLAMLSLGVAMIVVDATIVNVSVPAIIRDLKLDGTAAEWVNSIYSLVFAALLITVGRFGDVLGRRATYLAGLTVFMGASLLAGLAPTGETLILARLAQGVGGAMILPSTQSILNSEFQGRERAIAFGIWGSVIGGVAAFGPLLGGWLTTYLAWRWAFLINLPIGLFAIAGTLRYIHESRDEDARLGFDLPGFVLVTLGLGGVVFGLIEGYSYGWGAPVRPFSLLGWTWPLETVSVVPVAITAGLVALAAFAVVEVRRKRAGRFFLFDFDLWRYRAFRYGNLAGTIVSLGEFGLLFVLPLFLQSVIGYDAFQTGLVFLALAVGAFVAAPLAISLTRRFGGGPVVTTGMALEAIGILATTLLLSTHVTGLDLLGPLFVYGIGVGFATAQLTSIVLSDVPVRESGLASGTNSTLRQVGSALGIAILGTTLFTALGSNVADRFAAVADIPGVPAAVSATFRSELAAAIDGSAGQALTALRADPGSLAADGRVPPAGAAVLDGPQGRVILAPYIRAADEAFVGAARTAGLVAFGFVLLGLVLSLLLPRSGSAPTEARAPASAPTPSVTESARPA